MEKKEIRIRMAAWIAGMVFGMVGATVTQATLVSDLPDMSDVNVFAVVGNNVNLANVTVDGDVGVSRNGKLTFMAASIVNGDLYLDSGVTKTISGPYGKLYEPVNLSSAQGEVYSASAALAALAADVTYANWTSPLTIAGNGGVNVLKITGDVNLSSKSITLTGGPNDIFVINVLGGFDLGGSGGIIAGSGMDPSRIIINMIGTGTKVTSKVTNVVNGTMLLPYRQMEFHSVSGAVYGGNLEIKLMSDCTVNHVPFVPEPATLSLLALGSLVFARRRR